MRNKIKYISFFVLLAIAFNYKCTLFKKTIPKPVVVKITTPNPIVTIQQSANIIKYVNLFTEEEYTAAFIKNFNTEGSATPNITIDNASINPDYLIEIKNIQLSETDFLEKINDPKSEFNGKEFLLNKVECTAELICIDAKTNKQIGMSCSNFKSKQENLKNNRNLGDIVTGTNKDKSSYRQKMLKDNIALDLVGDVGRRIWVPLTKRIKKAIN